MIAFAFSSDAVIVNCSSENKKLPLCKTKYTPRGKRQLLRFPVLTADAIRLERDANYWRIQSEVDREVPDKSGNALSAGESWPRDEMEGKIEKQMNTIALPGVLH